MTETKHDTIVIERRFAHAPERVFAAFAQPEAVKAWARPAPEMTIEFDGFDFREGGVTTTRMTMDGMPPWISVERFHEIVPGRRIIQSSTVHHDGHLTFAGVVTLAFAPAGMGCALTLTEQGVFPEGRDEAAMHRAGWESMFGMLEGYLGGAR